MQYRIKDRMMHVQVWWHEFIFLIHNRLQEPYKFEWCGKHKISYIILFQTRKTPLEIKLSVIKLLGSHYLRARITSHSRCEVMYAYMVTNTTREKRMNATSLFHIEQFLIP